MKTNEAKHDIILNKLKISITKNQIYIMILKSSEDIPWPEHYIAQW